MNLASSGKVRRRKNPQKSNTSPSSPAPSLNGSGGSSAAQVQKKRRSSPINDHHSNDSDKTRISTGTNNAPSKNEYEEYTWFIVFLIAAEQSRDAHGWKGPTSEVNHGDDNVGIDILFQSSGVIEGMALGLDFSNLCVLVTTRKNDSSWAKQYTNCLLAQTKTTAKKVLRTRPKMTTKSPYFTK